MRSLLAIGALVLGLAPAAADTTTNREKELSDSQKQIDALSSRKFVDRERACRALEAIGEPALEPLRAALKSDDSEVRSRAEEVIARIERQAANRKLLQAPSIRLQFRGAELRTVITELNKKTGLNFVFDEKHVGNASRPITVDTGDVPLWTAVDKVLAAAGLTELDQSPVIPAPILNDGTSSTIQLQQGAQVWTSWSGRAPMAPQNANKIVLVDGKSSVSSATNTAVRVRALPRDFPGNGITKGSGEISFTLDVTPAPTLQWQGLVGVEVHRAIDENGQSLTQAHVQTDDSGDINGMFWDGPQAFGGGFGGRGIMIRQQMGWAMNDYYDMSGAAPGNPRHVPVTLLARERRSKNLKELSGVVTARVLTPPQTLVSIDNILKATGNSTYRADATSIQINDVKVLSNGGITMRVHVEMPSMVMQEMMQMNVRVRGRAMPFIMVNDQMSVGQGMPQFALQDADGKPFRLIQQNHMGSSDNGQIMTQDIQFQFQPGKAQKEAARLVLTGRRLADVDVPFILKNVPLP